MIGRSLLLGQGVKALAHGLHDLACHAPGPSARAFGTTEDALQTTGRATSSKLTSAPNDLSPALLYPSLAVS